MENNDTGILLNKHNIELHKKWFKQFTKLRGLQVLYRAPRESKQYDRHGELDALYYEPIKVGCIYNDHPDQKSMKKMGWNAELSESTILITVPEDLEKLQVGALFIVPSGLNNAVGRVFKVIKMYNIAIYPCTITCELGPVLESDFEQSNLHDFKNSNFNLLNEEEDD